MSSIFPENDWEEKEVNQVALARAGGDCPESSACDNKPAACGDTGLRPAPILRRRWRFSYRGKSDTDTLDEQRCSQAERTT
jgi:hypothetical protein